ncbi:MAG: Co2+/Mg2+ efflux protein ApaG [Phycisphaeraceae bacterium]|nr:Co2+/Mg2+ efflux protein ApaG [Phycisphaeraceae bacterium]
MTGCESHAVTRGVRVEATPRFLAEQSSESRWVWAYRIRITNVGTHVCTLLWRRWQITDGNGDGHEVQGSGVVGRQPRLAPGESFEYESYCPLPTDSGSMEGWYTMQREDGTLFEAAIPLFVLRVE